MRLSSLGQFIIDALTWRVRVIADTQLGWLLNKNADVNSELAKLTRRGLLGRFSLPTSLLVLESPLYCWERPQPEPDYWKLSWAAESRFRKSKPICHSIFHATKLAERQFGGIGGKIRQPFQLAHDLGTTSIFLAHTQFSIQTRESNWMSEDILRRYFRNLNLRKIPDAAIVKNDQLAAAIEFVGRDYSARHIRRFHQYWEKKNTPYQLW